MTLISRDQMPPSTPYEAELRTRLARTERERDFFCRLVILGMEPVIRAARELHVVYAADGEGFVDFEPYLEKLSLAVSDLNDWAARHGSIPSILDVLEDPNGPAAEHVFPELMKKADE